MPDRPLLMFPAPETADRTRGYGFPRRMHRPTHNQQGLRLSPIFMRLQTEINARRVELQQTAAGADPEQVIVIETIGSIENFANAVKRIDGFEWMGEIETDEITPDEDFFNVDDPDKKLSGRLYLVMTNQRALNEIISLWQRYQEDPDMEFERGLTRFREVFKNLKDLRRWSIQDRIEETGIIDAWREDLVHYGDQVIHFEVELWFRSTHLRQQQAQVQIEELVNNLEGKVIDSCIITDIAYHALLAEIPAREAQNIINHPDVDLIKCDNVMFFRPVGQILTGDDKIESILSDSEGEEAELPSGPPIIALLDGLPMSNHSLLANRLIIDDPDEYAETYTVSDRIHGTAMSSLIIHGDLSEENPTLSHPIYVRPIMKPITWITSPKPEQVPDDILVVDQIHRAVIRMIEGEGHNEPIAPTIRIINFSIGDRYRPFNQILSPLARLLDWISYKYKVLFVISAGNHSQNINIEISKNDFDELSQSEKEEEVIKTLYGDARNRRIISPAESINGISVGALHYDTSEKDETDPAINLFENILPSPISAFGSGHRRSIKPDVVYSGGRVLHNYNNINTNNTSFRYRELRKPPGNKVATPSIISGEISKVTFSCGTSNATALITRLAGACHDALAEVFEDQAPEIELNSYISPLVKAMIVHGSAWGEIGSRIKEILRTSINTHQLRSWVSRWLGYGVPDGDRVMDCTEERATLVGFGQLNDEEAHVFNLPLPSALSARREWRRLTVTLAWMSPIAANTQRYRTASLWFEIENNSITPERQNADTRNAKRGTVQHEIFEGERAIAITEDTNLRIKVNCRKDASRILEPVAYGLIVSLEVAEGVDIAIYDEIRTRLATVIEIRARGET